jgi:multidrug efflux pump subunit AcrA (membrane-fusion protein)
LLQRNRLTFYCYKYERRLKMSAEMPTRADELEELLAAERAAHERTRAHVGHLEHLMVGEGYASEHAAHAVARLVAERDAALRERNDARKETCTECGTRGYRNGVEDGLYQRQAQSKDRIAALSAQKAGLVEALRQRTRYHEYKCHSTATTLGDAVPPCSCGVDDARAALAAAAKEEE